MLRADEFGITSIEKDAEQAPDPNIAEGEAARKEYAAQIPVRPRRLREFHRRQLRRAAALGLSVRIEARDADRTCRVCAALDGQQFPAASAPLFPLDQCGANYICDCGYVFVAR